jgi:hypothetical protein
MKARSMERGARSEKLVTVKMESKKAKGEGRNEAFSDQQGQTRSDWAIQKQARRRAGLPGSMVWKRQLGLPSPALLLVFDSFAPALLAPVGLPAAMLTRSFPLVSPLRGCLSAVSRAAPLATWVRAAAQPPGCVNPRHP